MTPKSAPTIAEAAPIALAHAANLSPSTRKRYSEAVGYYLKDHARVAPQNLTVFYPTTENVGAWIAKMQTRGLAPSTIRSYVAAMRTIFDVLRDLKVATGDNAFHVRNGRLPKIGHRVPKTITREDFERILKDAKDRELWHQPFLAVIGYAGLRCEEARTLKVADVSLDRRTITVIGKGNKERVVRMTGKLVTILAAYIPRLPQLGSLLFPSPYDFEASVSKTAIRSLIDTTCRKLGITAAGDKVTPHTFRRLTASMIGEAGGKIEDMRKVLGHASIGTTQKYFDPSDERTAGIMDKL